MQSLRPLALVFAVSLAATSVVRAQCPNGTPPPCDTRATAPLTLIKRAVPAALDDRTYIVLPFQNITRAPDAEWLSDAAVNMLSMDLSRWQDIKVVDDRRVADYLREAGTAKATKLSMNDGLSVAKRAGAGKLVMGDVMKVGNRLTVTASLINARDGKQIRSVRQETVVDSVMPMFGRLAQQILAVPASASGSGSVGTSRVDAYKEYVAGNQALNVFDAPTAKKHYEAALALDSNFALAHYKWAFAASYDEKAAAQRQAQVKITDLNSLSRLLEDPDRTAHARAAGRLSAGLPARERALIAGLVGTVNKDYGRACDHYRGLVRADSMDVDALYGAGLCLLSDDMVEPVVEGDTTKMRFRTSWNESLDMLRRAASVDPTFHLAFDAIVGILTAGARVGCARKDLLEACSDTAIKRRYVAVIQREGDSLVTTPRSGFTTVISTIADAQRMSAPRANVELASRAAADWIALAPNEARAHRQRANLLLRLGRTAEAQQEMNVVVKDPSLRSDNEFYLRRLEVALKLMQGDEVIRLIDSMPMANPSDLGRANAANYAVVTGRFRGMDSVYGVMFAAQAGLTKERLALAKQANRILAGVPSDSLAAIEQAFVAQAGSPVCGPVCVGGLAVNYATAFRVPRKWPEFSPELREAPVLLPGIAASRRDTAAMRKSARWMDSVSQRRVATARTEDGSTIIAAEAYLSLGDSVAALQMARRLTDTTLQLSGIEASLTNIGGATALVWPRAMLLRADLEAAKGERRVARDYYTRFLALWAKSDPEFAPLMARVRASLAALPPA